MLEEATLWSISDAAQDFILYPLPTIVRQKKKVVVRQRCSPGFYTIPFANVEAGTRPTEQAASNVGERFNSGKP